MGRGAVIVYDTSYDLYLNRPFTHHNPLHGLTNQYLRVDRDIVDTSVRANNLTTGLGRLRKLCTGKCVLGSARNSLGGD